MSGVIRSYFSNGKKYNEVEYKDGKISGFIRIYNENGNVISEVISNSPNLTNEVLTSNKSLTVCAKDANYFYIDASDDENSFLSNTELLSFEDGTFLIAEFCDKRIFSKSGKPVNEKVTERYSNGQIKYEMNYKNGKYDKKWIEFYDYDGNLRTTIKETKYKSKRR